MVLDKTRGTAGRFLDPIANSMKGISPNTISALSFVLAVLAAIAIIFSSMSYSYLLVVALVLVALSGFLDALDGAVARVRGISSTKGDFLDHVLDRYSDIALLLALTFSVFYSSVVIGVFALVGVLMTSYMGTQSQSVCLKRNYGGPLGRADRIAQIMAALLVQYDVSLFYSPSTWYGSVFFWLLLFFAVLGNITAVYRALVSWRQL